MRTLTVDDLLLIHMQIIDASGGSQGVRDTGRLEAAVATQTQETFDTVMYVSLYDKAAALCRGIIGDHPFIDGNKRTGIMTALIFLEQNGIKTMPTDQELEDFAVSVATDHLSVQQIADWLRQNSREQHSV